jgi:alkylation response protein AidB-like acyl-CoA dehydrogenase
MQLVPTPEQQALLDAVERFCREELPPERLQAWEREPRRIDDHAWRAIAALGWFGLGVPEAHGGSGLGLTEVACLLQECGRGLVPRSVINAIHGAWALARLAPDAAELAAVARGEQVVALALDEREARDPACFRATLVRSGGAAHVSGEKWYVPEGAVANHYVVAARDGGELVLVLVGRDGARAHPLRAFDGEQQAVLRFERAPVARQLATGVEALAALRREATALALAEMCGGMRAALDMTVAYVKEREQFGQKMAVFQAVQHQIADMAIAYTAARHLIWQAITRVADGGGEGGELDAAVAFAAPAFKRITLAAHHLHGGAGYVVEHPLHRHSERAQALALRCAREPEALAAVARTLLD